MNEEQVSIIIPAFNEADGVGDVVKSLKSLIHSAEIIVVDDGSTDDTARIAAENGAHIITHAKCRGYGNSLKTGIRAATREFVLFCDGDGQHQAEDVKKLITEGKDQEMVVGKRGRSSHAPLLRRPGKFILRTFANFLAGEKIPDLNSGLRIIKKDVLIKYIHLMPGGFSFSTTSTFALLKGNHNVRWVPITVKERKGTSTVRQWKHGPETIMLMLRLTVLFEPLKVFLWTSAGLFFLTLISLSIDIITGGKFGIGDTTVTIFLSTLLVFLFGLLCDQVSALRRELHE